MGAARWVLGVTCGLACVGCPCVIAWLSVTYAETGLDADFDPWPLHAVDGSLWLAAVATVGLIGSLRTGWRWVGVAAAVPLLALTAVLAVAGGMWIEGTYF